MDERKRRRGPEISESMDYEGGHGLLNTEAVLSNADCTVSSPVLLAKLAMQASHSK